MSPTERHDLHEIVTSAVKDAVGPLETRLASIETHLTGGDDPSRGIHVRIDRLEQGAKTQARWTGWIVPALLGTAIATAWKYITGH